MSIEIDVLGSLLRLARRRTSPTLDQIVERVGADEPAVRAALGALAKSGLVQRIHPSPTADGGPPPGLRLSLAGLAVAVACAKRPRVAPAQRAQSLPKGAPIAARRSRRAA